MFKEIMFFFLVVFKFYGFVSRFAPGHKFLDKAVCITYLTRQPNMT
jgi:hypothetical protein